MLLVLSAKNKIGFVDGTIEIPDKTSPEYKFWARCNDLVISWLIFNIDVTIAKSVMFLQTAREIWSDLEERYGYASMTEVYSLEQKLSKIVQVWDGISDANPLPVCTCKKCTCNLTQRIQDRQQDQKLLQFMMKLNDDFVAIRANVLMMQPLPNVSAAFRLFAQEERHKEISHVSNQNESMAFLADRMRGFDNNRSVNRQGYFSGNNNSNAQFRTNLNGNNSTGNKRSLTKPGSNYYCTHCKVPGHSIDRCFKIHGFPANFRGNKDQRIAALASNSDALISLAEHKDDDHLSTTNTPQTNNISQEQYSQLMEVLNRQHISDTQSSASITDSHSAHLTGKTCLLSYSTSKWLLDSGATDHITNTIDDFCQYSIVSDIDNTITIPNGNKVPVTHIGNVLLHGNIMLKDVLLVPSFQFKLISTHKLCLDLGCQLIFNSDCCLLQDHSQKGPTLLGKMNNGLYSVDKAVLKNSSSPIQACLGSSSSSIPDSHSASLWHFNTSILCVRSDNALELTAGKMQELYLKEGIINQTTCAYSPQQNGVVERKHRHLLETARAMYIQSKVPDKYRDIIEPTSYLEASGDPLWTAAMQKEIQALQDNNTWTLVDLPKGKKPIGCKWVYKVKLKSDGSLERCKARLVAKGFTQKYGIYYQETFSPVVKMSTVRCLIALAAHNNWKLYQLDVNNAFLHGTLKEEVYMKVPEGILHTPTQVCKLNKSIYGLKQASREWHETLVDELINQGFYQSKLDYSLFICKDNTDITIVVVYVDDILVTGSNLAKITALKQHLHAKFTIKDLGVLHYFLGIEVSYLAEGTVLSQTKYTKEIMQLIDADLSKKALTPLPLDIRLTADDGPLFENAELYRSIVGKLNFLTNTRPDLSYTVQVLSQFLQNPRKSHYDALLHTLRYLNVTIGQGILLKASNAITLEAFSDSDWASCPDSRRSVTGYILMLGNSLITWKSKKQSTVSRSSSEAEYRAMASAASEVVWTVKLLEELGVQGLQPVQLNCDNQSALHIARNPVFHERTKHIEIDCHFTRDKGHGGSSTTKLSSHQESVGRCLKKNRSFTSIQRFIVQLGMVSPCSPPNLREGISYISN
ncbi:uncharacterized protein LOC141665234 [Apium graveolens]|uniref:uncharacterized protein LOC141665234 n=1 Tax=Apium graveolens TaxID=4045 RepID=UPI003D7B6ED9